MIPSTIIFFMAVWRISYMLVSERGPFRVFEHMRNGAGILHDDQGNPYMYPDGFFSEILHCIWCTSVWVSLFMSILTWVAPGFAVQFAMIFAFSTGAIIIDAIINRLNHRS